MNRIVFFSFTLFLIFNLSGKNKSEVIGDKLTYKESEMHKKLHKMEKMRSKTRKLKSFADEERAL